MELAHNIGHGQWDWMNDPEIHSTTWEWDMVGPSSQWRYSHNYRHHVFTNVVGMDDDLGYGVLGVTRDHRWKPSVLLSPLRTYCWRSRSSGASRCRAFTRCIIMLRQTPRNPPDQRPDPQVCPAGRQGLSVLS